MDYKIALIPGDGIGPEIVREAKKVLDKVCENYGHSFSYSEVLLGGASIDLSLIHIFLLLRLFICLLT